jgi:hypothetical protein
VVQILLHFSRIDVDAMEGGQQIAVIEKVVVQGEHSWQDREFIEDSAFVQ